MEMCICENCYDEVKSVVNYKGAEVCRSCLTELRSEKLESSEEVSMLEGLDDIVGIASDDDIINQYSEIANFQREFDYY
jgi:predicted amidophosphoribosyltransferase